MASVLESVDTLEIEDQTAFNLAVWEQVLADPELARLPYRVETDRHGQLIMSPPPHYDHARRYGALGVWLMRLLPRGFVLGECPISTREGVKGIDVAWISRERDALQKGQACLTQAPEICVEILAPSNTPREIREKRALYFAAGAEEVWFCRGDATIEVFLKDAPEKAGRSRLCPELPDRLEMES
jgi:Uma2 family endonuclease